ncbi:MAG: ABC-F family ATP-binding cassette domain-containing protein [Clostridia bacterium]|nr:ABC-F family ATP-binding cassette domain-containing protein [Clostridia bacterium]
MSIIEIKGLTHRYDDKDLFAKADLTVNNGEHIGVVGLNGAGKSTFINILAGKLVQDDGIIKRAQNLRIGYLDQHATLDGSLTVMQYLRGAFSYLDEMNARLEKLYADMANADGDELDRLITKSSSLQERLDDAGYYDLEAQIKKVANGLGVNHFGYDAVISTLSGGERAKLMLSKLLLESYDLALLDEPTNFLDVEHVEWLENYLSSYKKTFLVISHDVKFLNAVAKVIVSIENGAIRRFSGNYDQYLVQREAFNKQYEDDYNRQQAEIKRLQDYIDKNRARASTASMANSRKKMLDRMEIMAKPTIARDCEFSFPYLDLNAKKLLVVEGLKIGYDRQLVPDISFTMSSVTKLWIRGTNGVGKTTLIKTLLRKIHSLGGAFTFHIEARPVYIEQELRFENKNLSPYAIYLSEFPDASQKEARAALAKVGLSGELAIKPVGTLSGGEMMRLKLAIASRTPSNLLILDEPTNHLDVKAKEALKKALCAYPGAVLLVTHEPDFASAVCEEVFDARAKD